MIPTKHGSHDPRISGGPGTGNGRLCRPAAKSTTRPLIQRAVPSGLADAVRGRSARLPAALLGFLWLSSAAARAEEAPVTISGGVQEDGLKYEWVVTNRANSPVVRVEFPHYQARLFSAPPGWKSECTFLVNVKVPKKPGTCKAWVESPRDGIARGSTATFGASVTQLESRPGRGVVKIVLADGTVLNIPNVEVPSPPSLVDRWGGLITFAVLGALLVLITVRRRRRQPPQAQAAEGPAGSGPPLPPPAEPGTQPRLSARRDPPEYLD